MFETVQAIDVFFIVMALSIAIATIVGALIGWHVFGIARDAHKVVSAVRDEGEAVVHEAAVAVKHIVEEKAQEIRQKISDIKPQKPRRKSTKRKLVTG
ncbi:MAG: hypothetical protein AMXMBFR44_4720 [Candidatus Campbellbacteria bacterium]